MTMETTGTLHSLGSVDSSPAVSASGRVVRFCGPAGAIFFLVLVVGGFLVMTEMTKRLFYTRLLG